VRKLALAGIAGMLIGGAVVAAVASSAATVSAVPARLTLGSPAHPQGVKLTTALSWQGLKPSNAPTINKIDLWFPTGTRYNGASYPSCSYARLNAAGPSACPKDSVMGSGEDLMPCFPRRGTGTRPARAAPCSCHPDLGGRRREPAGRRRPRRRECRSVTTCRAIRAVPGRVRRGVSSPDPGDGWGGGRRGSRAGRCMPRPCGCCRPDVDPTGTGPRSPRHHA